MNGGYVRGYALACQYAIRPGRTTTRIFYERVYSRGEGLQAMRAAQQFGERHFGYRDRFYLRTVLVSRMLAV